MSLWTKGPAVISSFVGVGDSLYVYILVREKFPNCGNLFSNFNV